MKSSMYMQPVEVKRGEEQRVYAASGGEEQRVYAANGGEEQRVCVE